MLYDELVKYAGSLVKIGTLSASIPPGMSAVDGFYVARLVGQAPPDIAVIEAPQGMDAMLCPYTISFYFTPTPDHVWVVPASAIVCAVTFGNTTPVGPNAWPDKCPLCGKPGKASFVFLKCSNSGCKNYG